MPVNDPILVGQGIPLEVFDFPADTELEVGGMPPLNWGFEIQPFQPPAPLRSSRIASAVVSSGERLDQQPPSQCHQWYFQGWHIQPPQPPHTPRPGVGAMVATGERLDQQPPSQCHGWLFQGWHIQPPQPPQLRAKLAAAVMPREDGIEKPITVLPKLAVDQAGALLLNRAWAVRDGFAAMAGAQLPNMPPFGVAKDGWEIQSFQPPVKPRLAASGVFASGERLDQQPPSQCFKWYFQGWHVQPPQPPQPRNKLASATLPWDAGNKAIPYVWFDTGWEIQPYQPPQPRAKLFGGIAPHEDGIEAKLIPDPAFILRSFHWDWDKQGATFVNRAFATSNSAGALAGPQLVNEPPGQLFEYWIFMGLDLLPFQPPAYPPRSVAAMIATGERLDQQPPSQTGAWIFQGFDLQAFQPPRYPRAGQQAAAFIGDACLLETPLPMPNFLHWGYDAQPVQPKAFLANPYSAAIACNENGIEYPLYVAAPPMGWAVQSMQPPHYPVAGLVAAILRGDDGIEHPQFPLWYVMGWEVQPPQPLLNRSSRLAMAIMPWAPPIKTFNPFLVTSDPLLADSGIPILVDSSGVPILVDGSNPPITPAWGFDREWAQFQYPNPAHWRYAGLLASGDPQNQLQPIILFYPQGWGVQGVQPNAPKHPSAIQENARWEIDPKLYTIIPAPLSWGFEGILPLLPPYAAINAHRWGAIDRSISSRIINITVSTPQPPPPALVRRGYPAVPLWQPSAPHIWSARLGDILRSVRQGKQNVTLNVTLRTSNTTTTVVDVRISAVCGLILVPLTANAVAIQNTVWVSARQAGQATLTHSSTGNADCTFELLIIG